MTSVTCPSCGVANSSDAAACRMCGADLEDTAAVPRAGLSDRPGYRPKFKTCSRCGRSFDNHLAQCPHCETKLPENYDITHRRSPMPLIAATSLFVAGMLSILNGMFIGSFGYIAEEFAYCGFIEIVLGVISIIGWIFCMMRSYLPLVIVICVMTILSIGPVFVVPLSSLLGLFALILVAVSIKEFR